LNNLANKKTSIAILFKPRDLGPGRSMKITEVKIVVLLSLLRKEEGAYKWQAQLTGLTWIS
jgi:hypothetical protein